MDTNQIKKQNLRRVLNDKNIDNKTFSELVGVSEQRISNIFKGNSGISDKLISKYADILNVDKAEFYKGMDTSGSLTASVPAPTITISSKQDKPPTQASAINRLLYIMEHGTAEEIEALDRTLDAIKQDVDRKKESSLPGVTGTQKDGEAMGRKAA